MNTAQNNQSNPVPQAPITPGVQQPPQQQGAVHSFTPVGTGSKEHVPAHPMPEYAGPVERVPDLPQTVQEAGVEHSPEIKSEQQLSQIHQATQELVEQQQQGLISPTPTLPPQNFPYTPGEVEKIVKEEPVDSGKRWLGVQVGKLLKQFFFKNSEPQL